MKSFLFLLFSLIYFYTPVISQPASHFTVRYYTTENGLPSNGVKGLQWEEKTGFLWIATEAGIVRFNGIDFKSYTKENTNYVQSERIQYLTRNYKNEIYAADQVGTVLGIRQNKVFYIKTLLPDKETDGFNSSGIVVSEQFLDTKQKDKDIRSYAIGFHKFLPLTDTSLLIIKNNTLYLNTISVNGSRSLDFAGIKIKTGFILNNKYFLVTDKNELYNFETVSKTIHPVPFSGPAFITSLLKDGKATLLWEIGQENPIILYENFAWQLVFDGEKIISEDICNAVPTGILFQHVLYSKEKKLLFLGTNSKGLIVISSNKVQPAKNKHIEGDERNAYYSQIELSNGNILTNEGHIIGTKPVSSEPLPIEGKFGFNISKTGDSLLWYSQYETDIKFNTLHSYNFRTAITKNYSKIKSAVHFVITLKNNKTIVLNETGLGELQDDSLHYLFLFGEKKLKNIPSDLVETEPGKVAFAVRDVILSFNTSSLKLDTLLQEENLYPRTLFWYKDYLFVGTYGKGFYIIKGNKAKAMPLDKNKFLLYTHCFMPDKLGYCWMSTNRGLFKVKLDELLNAFDKNINTVYYHYLGKNDGMDMTEMNGGCTPCAIALKKGTLSFPTMDGLLWVSPEQANILLPEGELYIDEVLADNKKVNIDSLSLKNLGFNTREIKFYLGFSAWCNKENIYIDYKLNNDAEWTPLNTTNGAVIQFNNLPQGKYVLQIRKLNGFGINNYSYRKIEFTINTPWHKTWWFYTVCMLLLLALISLYFRLRTKQFKQRQKKLEKQVTEKTKELLQKNEVLEKSNSINTRLISIISHDIITPLKFLTVAGKSLQEKRSQMPEELQQETISEMANTSQELQLLSTNILNWFKYQNENRRLLKETFNLHELVQQVLGILQSLAKQKKLMIENLVDEKVEVNQFYEPLKILIYNLLTNAIHFTEKGAILVDAVVGDGYITVSVKDEGIGMTPEKIKSLMADQVVISSANVDNKKGHGLGYLIIKDLLKTMGATLHIESKKGEGSKVSIRFDLQKTNSFTA